MPSLISRGLAATCVLALAALASITTTSAPASAGPVSGESVVRMSVESRRVTDSAGNRWEARSGISGGHHWDGYQGKRLNVAGTDDDVLYRSEIAGLTSWRRTLAPGTYDVTLRMREAWWNAPGKRVFDVAAEGRPVLTGVDVFKAVGRDHAYDRTFRVKVTDGRLDLAFTAERDLPMVSAIEVVKVSQQQAVGSVTMRPAQISGHIAGPERGQYLWYPDEYPTSVPASLSAADSYARFTWRQIEPRPGAYDFSAIDAHIAKARARGGTFSFRVMPVCSWCGSPNALPADLDASPRTWSHTLSDGEVIRVPDWNDPAYLTRWDGLMKVLGARYDTDPAVGYVDTGGYGNWGEGHNWPYESSYPRPSGQRSATVATANAIVGSVVRHFSKSFVLHSPFQMRSDAQRRYDPEATWAALRSALTMSRRVGIRNDCLGGGSIQAFAVQVLRDSQSRAEAEGVALEDRPLDRWRVAPFVTEWCDSIDPSGRDGTFAQGAKQVSDFHVSLLSNGNFKGALGDYPAAERAAFMKANENAGYRYAVDSVRVASTRAGGAGTGRVSTTISARWTNSCVAPTYRGWTVQYDLRDAHGSTVARATSDLRLSGLLGAGEAVDDTVTLATSSLRPGSYSLHVRVLDDEGYRPAMAIASGVRAGDGSYRLGTVAVAG